MAFSPSFNPVGKQYEDLYRELAVVRRDTPIFYWEAHGCWVVTRYEDITAVLNDKDHFTVEGILGVMNNNYCPEANEILSRGIDFIRTPQVNGVEGADHARLRGIMQAILTPARFRQMEPFVRKNVIHLIDTFAADGHCDFVPQFAYPLPVRVIFDVIGFKVEEENLAQLQEWSDDYFRMWLAPLTPEEQVRCAKHIVEFQNYTRAKLADRRRAPRDDLMTDFVRQLDAGQSKVTEDEVVIMFPMNFIGAGHETTKSALTNALYQLLREPSRWQAIIDDPDSIPAVVEECLRMDTSVPAWYRIVKEDVELSGQKLPKGARVIMMLAAANHDEARFDEPERFCPARSQSGQRSGHLTFSYGRHFCMGAPLARLEMRVALEELSARLKNLQLRPGQSFEYEPNVATRVLKSLQLQWDAAR
ncbi:cytochrome P450 [Sinimarinibacterium flocculans]|uniref:cytochrome P450 n=1 Tax=Sinimarinibacterium flocculans TaxID=985250 RepID=UPI002492BBFB|nr:cytochrome P450 [Sinimarinibacterium flocculans]